MLTVDLDSLDMQRLYALGIDAFRVARKRDAGIAADIESHLAPVDDGRVALDIALFFQFLLAPPAWRGGHAELAGQFRH